MKRKYTHQHATKRQLALTWGVSPVIVENFADTDEMFKTAISWVLKNYIARKGDRIILTAGFPIGVQGTTNLLKAIELT